MSKASGSEAGQVSDLIQYLATTGRTTEAIAALETALHLRSGLDEARRELERRRALRRFRLLLLGHDAVA